MSTSLARLRFIHFAGWSVFGRLRGDHPAGWRSRPGLAFISDHDGDPAEYLAAFGIAVTGGMRRAFGSIEGFPGPLPTRRFIDYVEQGWTPASLRYSAYPGVTVRDVDAAVAVAECIENLAAADDAETWDDVRFETDYRGLVDALARVPQTTPLSILASVWQALWSRSSVSGLTVLVPIRAGRTADVGAAIDELAARSPSVFDEADGVHYARMAVVAVPGRRRHGEPQPDVDHLLLSAWFDGRPDDFVPRLVAALGDDGAASALWSGCAGYPGVHDPRAVAAWIRGHRLHCSMFLSSRSGLTVARIQELVALREQAFDVVAAAQGRPLADIRRELKVLWQ